MFAKKDKTRRTGAADQIRTLIRQARQVAEGLDRAAFNRRPAENSWSVGECLDHLNASVRLYLPVIAEAIQQAREKELVGGDSDGRTWLGRLVAWSQEPPPRFKTRTFSQIEPARDLDPAAVLEEFEALHEELIVRINEAADLDRKRIKIRSALDSRLKLSLGDWFAFLASHGRRHLHQAGEARAAIGAPGTGG